MSEPEAGASSKSPFPTTRWSRVAATVDPAEPGARAALEELCRSYWYPLYALIRRRGHSPDEAADLTQAYFVRLLDTGLIARADRRKGRFRAFLRTDCGFFLSHRAESDRAQKRGGGETPLSIDARAAEERRRRRLQLGLAASLLALTTLGGLTFTYEQHRRQAVASRVDQLLAEARLLRAQAQAMPEDVGRWKRAREAVDRIGEEPGPSAAAELAKLRRQVEAGLSAAEADRDLLARLVDIRSALADDTDGSATDATYADAFATAGIDPDQGDPVEAGARVAHRPASVAAALVAALDDWSAVRRMRDEKNVGWSRVLAVARAADPDPDRNSLRDALLVEDQTKRLDRLRPLVKRANARSWAPASLILLGASLANAGDVDAGVAVLRRASWSHPEDARVHYNLGKVLERVRPPQPEDVIRAYSVAWARQPELAGHDLAHALEQRGRGAEAEAVWRDLIGRRPDNGRHLGCYGRHLKKLGRGAEAEAVLARAVAALREVIRLKPDDAVAHSDLGNALYISGDMTGAISEYREAIRLKPDFAGAHSNLGIALRDSGDVRGAIAACREAIRLKPDFAGAHSNLGSVLYKSGDVRGMIAACREAIRLKPDFAEAHYNLGIALVRQGQYAESLLELRTGHELGSKRADWRYPSAQWVAEAERRAALVGRIPALLVGTDKPADNTERLTFARMLYDTKRYAAAARLWSEALAADPKLGDDRRARHRYNAACAATLAAAGRDENDPKPDNDAKTNLRHKALDWLRAERATWSKVVDSGDSRARALVTQILRHWKVDTDLASVRDEAALSALPEPERAEWKTLWAEVDQLLDRAGKSHESLPAQQPRAESGSGRSAEIPSDAEKKPGKGEGSEANGG